MLAEKPKDDGLDQISQEKNSDFTYNGQHHDSSDRRLNKFINLPNIVNNNAQKDNLCGELHLSKNWATGTILARLLNIIFGHLLDILAGSSGSQIINGDDLQVSSGIRGSPTVCNAQ